MITKQMKPIGFYSSDNLSKYELSRQPKNHESSIGIITLLPDQNYDQALMGLEEFERIWLIFYFDRSPGFKTKVLPSKLGKKVGLFATRAPHRPNPIGISCVQIIKINKNCIFVQGADLLDNTPILDVKPYVPSCDSFPVSKAGWVDDAEKNKFCVVWSDLADFQRSFLNEHAVHFSDEAFHVLTYFRGPNHYNRIVKIHGDHYFLSYKTWRFYFKIDQLNKKVEINRIASGYTIETMQNIVNLDEKKLHEFFISKEKISFSSPNNIHLMIH